MGMPYNEGRPQDMYGNVPDRVGRNHLTKSQASLGGGSGGGGEEKKQSRFTKRQSKNGLATVF